MYVKVNIDILPSLIFHVVLSENGVFFTRVCIYSPYSTLIAASQSTGAQ